MEYPRALIEEQLQKPEDIEVGWPWRLLVFTLFIFGLMLVIFLGIKFGYGPYLDKKAQTLDASISEKSQSLNQGQVDNFIKFYSQVANFKTLLSQHVFGSNILNFLEENTLKTLNYTSFSLDVARQEIKISGIAPDYEVLSQQLEIFRQSGSIKDIAFKNSSNNDKGGINFDATLTLKDDFFKGVPILSSASTSAAPVSNVASSTNSTSTNQ